MKKANSQTRTSAELPAVSGRFHFAGTRKLRRGSSREHAPWALTDYGFKVVLRRVLLTSSTAIALTTSCCREIKRCRSGRTVCAGESQSGVHFDVDLEAQEVKAGEKTYRLPSMPSAATA